MSYADLVNAYFRKRRGGKGVRVLGSDSPSSPRFTPGYSSRGAGG